MLNGQEQNCIQVITKALADTLQTDNTRGTQMTFNFLAGSHNCATYTMTADG